MSFVFRKHRNVFYIIVFSFFLHNCQLKEPNKSHGINFLDNREKVLIVGKTNKNDVIKIIGTPHTKSIKGDDTWIYFERTITRGKLIRLGQNVLKENNILELRFNKYGVLVAKKLYNKDDMKKVKYSKKITKNDVSQKSFVGKFLSSIKQKMYGKRQN
jgi:outer membrane protein assembly factor BamE (lipoprotein component of BamABCDE complex)|tara:strand:- start:187 stop:660 length:474 start_codon:yes stop_codon:yes gene_type:complete